MTKGHLYVAFGNEYDKAAAFSVAALRKHSSLPVCVLSNVPESNRHSKWSECKGVDFVYFRLRDQKNRAVKTRMCSFTPFDETLYTDCDTVILSSKVMLAFEILKSCDVAFPFYSRKQSDQRLATPIYKEALAKFAVVGNPLVYQGGVCVFRRNEASQRFFELWNKYWKVDHFRDMPPLMAAISNVKGVAIGFLSQDYGFPYSGVIQHFYGWRPPKTKQLPQFIKDAPNETKRMWEPRKCFR